jgi:hypothetical protein
VNYFQVVFTLPKELSRLSLGNRRVIYNLLFRSSWQALRETVEDEQRYEMSAALVLHTWNQKLEAHAHVHAIVPGGGPSLDCPGQWRRTRRRGTDNPFYLVEADALRRNYRDAFLAGLEKLLSSNTLKLDGDFAHLLEPEGQQELLRKLKSTQWVAYIEAPPSDDCKPEHVVRYLGRYLTGGPISDRRLLRADENEIVFQARSGDEAGGSLRLVEIRLSPAEFVRRWCLHVLPKGYVKTRRYGGWSNRCKEDYLQRCQALLQLRTSADPARTQPNIDPSADGPTRVSCQTCGQSMQLLCEDRKPSWRDLQAHRGWPSWYKPPATTNTAKTNTS